LLQALTTSNGLEPGLADSLLREAQSAMARHGANWIGSLSVVQHPLRVLLARFLRRSLPQLKVLSHAEIPDTRTIKVTAPLEEKREYPYGSSVTATCKRPLRPPVGRRSAWVRERLDPTQSFYRKQRDRPTVSKLCNAGRNPSLA